MEIRSYDVSKTTPGMPLSEIRVGGDVSDVIESFIELEQWRERR